MHYEDAQLKGVTQSLFEVLLNSPHQRDMSRLVLDEMLVVEPTSPRSLAKAFVDLMCWRSYEDYEQDLISCLGDV